MTEFRRVVTGHDENGRSIIASDEMVSPSKAKLLGGNELHMLWGADDPIIFPDSGAHPEVRTGFPPRGGFRVMTFQLQPDGSQVAPSWSEAEFQEAVAELEAIMPGYMKRMEGDATGFHATPSVDIEYILEGEVVIELDDGIEATLRAGDYFIQNGTRHHWHNRTSEAARILVFMLGVEHRSLPE
jgi:mannose-6-phosphate isomerase-like protein (cupin superfamily)